MIRHSLHIISKTLSAVGQIRGEVKSEDRDYGIISDMFFTSLLICSIAFADAKTLAVQICLDREGFSPNTIDGNWGRKSQSALEKFCADQGLAVPATPEAAYDQIFKGAQAHLFETVQVTAADLAAIVSIPRDPDGKSKLAQMGYESVKEMFAERGHMSRRGLERLNPHIKDWDHVAAGTLIKLPAFPSIDEALAAWPRKRQTESLPTAALVKISLSRFEVSVFDGNGKYLALFPCSIARNKAKIPAKKDLKIVTQIAHPNYTYTPDFVPAGKKASRYIFPSGPNCPVGVAWLGLDLPGYGIHGTPLPESIGNAESHGCFRLSNWNAARLYALCPIGTRVTIVD